MKRLALSLALSAGLLSGCVVNLTDPPVTHPSVAPNTLSPAGVTIAGMVRAPEGVISTGGGNVISTGGGNVISTGGGNVISTGGGNFKTLAVTENPLANTEVYVADAAGNAIPGLPTGVTDASGRFELKGVPADRTFVIVAKAKTAQGKDAKLQTLAKTTDVGTTADVDVNTTLVTAGVVETSGAKLGNFNPATFATAVQATAKNLTPSDVPDLSDRAAVTAQVKKLMNEVAELRTAIDEIRKELEEIKKELKDLRSEVEKLKAAQAGQPGSAPATGGTPSEQLRATIDADRNQTIALGEWVNFWRPAGLDDYDIGFMFGSYDGNFDDQLSVAEFERFWVDLNGAVDVGSGGEEPDEDPDEEPDDGPLGGDDDVEGDVGDAPSDEEEDDWL